MVNGEGRGWKVCARHTDWGLAAVPPYSAHQASREEASLAGVCRARPRGMASW